MKATLGFSSSIRARYSMAYQNALRLMSSLVLFGSIAAHAQSFPNRTITLVVPYVAGGVADALARAAADVLTKELGQTVIVDNRAGAGGSIGMEQVTRAPADGHTLVLTTSGSMAINPYVYNLRFKPLEDLASITVLADVPYVVVSNSESPYKDLAGLRSAAKAAPKSISFANGGPGSQAHLTQVLIEKAAGVELNIISYKGSATATNDLLGKQINLMIDAVSAQVPFIQSGKFHALFVTSAARSPALPQVPTAQEAGLQGFSSVGWFGLAAPKNTPPAVVSKIQHSIAQGFARPEVRQKLESLGFTVVASSPEEALNRARKDSEVFGPVVKQLGLKPL